MVLVVANQCSGSSIANDVAVVHLAAVEIGIDGIPMACWSHIGT